MRKTPYTSIGSIFTVVQSKDLKIFYQNFTRCSVISNLYWVGEKVRAVLLANIFLLIVFDVFGLI